MSSTVLGAGDNVLSLPLRANLDATRSTSNRVRQQLGLLQGYADLMEGLSARENRKILKLMVDKVAELTLALRPFMEGSTGGESPGLSEYRRLRSRNRQLRSEYESLLTRLQQNVDTTKRRRQAL